MAKLLVVALAFAALVAFAAAHTTVITTTIEDSVDRVSRQQCSRQIQGQRFNQCQRYLNQGQSSYEFDNRQSDRESCCQELRNVDGQCQCEAVQEAFQQALQQHQQQQGQQGFQSQQIRQLKQKAQNLPNTCNLQERQCQIGTISVTTATVIDDEDTNVRRRGSQSQQCQHIRGQRFNQCQRYIQQQIGSQGSPFNWQQQQGNVQQCCNELERVERECQCEAMQQVYRQAQQQMQYQQQGSRRGGQQPMQQDLQRVIQQLRNQCDIQVQQCRIPSAMF